jgi:RNA polymerase-binding transcription factor DksA
VTPRKSPPAKKSAPAEKAKATVKKAAPAKSAKVEKPSAKATKAAKPAPKVAVAPAKEAKAAKQPTVKAAPKATAAPAPKAAAPKPAAPAAKKAAPKPVLKAAAPAKAAEPVAAKTPAAKPAAPATEAVSKASAIKKLLLGKKPLKPVKGAPVAPKVVAKPVVEEKPLSNKEKLAKLLAMRAADAKAKSREAADEVRKGTGTAVPSSVHKAAEFAETRKISTIVKSGKRTAPEEAAPPPAKKAKKRKAPYSKGELKELKDILESERTRLLRDLAVMNEVATSSEENMSRSFSSHQADAATDSSALETTFVTRRYEEERLSQVTRALERLEAGTYGLCEMCTEEQLKMCDSCPFIPIGRLRAKPFAILCLPCRQELEKRNKR